MDEKRVIAYSFLAHVNNNKEGIRDLGEVFEPLVEDCLVKLVKNGTRRGVLADVKNMFVQLYAIDIPNEVLLSLLQRIEVRVRREHPGDFRLFGKGEFVVESVAFMEHAYNMSENEADIKYLEDLYCAYISTYSGDAPAVDKLYSFLDNNRIEIAGVVSGGSEESGLSMDEALFVKQVIDIPRARRAIHRIYLGSIISGYLEVDFGPKKKNKVEYVLDTSFIVQILGLADEDAESNAKRIIELCHLHSDTITVLDVTVDETSNLIERLINRFDEAGPVESLSASTLFGSIVRRGYKRTDLERILAEFTDTLEHKAGARLINTTDNTRNRVRAGSLFARMKDRKFNPEGAFHDAVAMDYVLSKRGKNIKSFNASKCWFISEGGADSHYLGPNGKELSPCIKPQVLVGVLWMSSPKVKSIEFVDLSLSRMIAGVLHRSLPDERIIREFDANLKRYINHDISPDSCVSLARNLAYHSVLDIEEANKDAKDNPDRFKALVENAIEVAAEYEEKDRVFKESIRQQIEEEYHKSSKEDRDKMHAELEKRLDEEVKKHQASLNAIAIQREQQYNEDLLQQFQRELSGLLQRRSEADTVVTWLKWLEGLAVVAVAVSLYLALVVMVGVEMIEKYSIIVFPAISLVAYIISALQTGVWNLSKVFDARRRYHANRLYRRYQCDVDSEGFLLAKITTVKKKLLM